MNFDDVEKGIEVPLTAPANSSGRLEISSGDTIHAVVELDEGQELFGWWFPEDTPDVGDAKDE